MAEIEKRGRGRPKGSLNKKTLAKQEEMEEAMTLDVSFEEPEIVPEAEVGQPEPEPEMEKPEVELEPVKKRAPRKTKVQVEEEEPVKRKRAPRKKIPVDSSDEEVPLPPPPPKPRPAEEPLTYLQVLQRGLVAARAADRADRSARYDAYFTHLH